MAVGYDSTEPLNIPSTVPPPDIALGYVDGRWPSFADMGLKYPNAIHVPISAIPGSLTALTAIFSDGERFDYNPDDSAHFSAQKIADNITPGCYCSLSNWADYADAHRSINIPPETIDWWIAAYPGNGHNIYPASIGHQYADMGTYDVSVFADDWKPGRPYHLTPQPPHVDPPEETDMITRNTAGKGYWAVRPSGDVYAYDGAPYLGPNPDFIKAWGIGTTDNPVVGITDDGHGGYVLMADRNQYPGTPALYRIDASGQYK